MRFSGSIPLVQESGRSSLVEFYLQVKRRRNFLDREGSTALELYLGQTGCKHFFVCLFIPPII